MRTIARAARFTTKSKGGSRPLTVCDECSRPRRCSRVQGLGRGLRTRRRACLLEDGVLCCGPATPGGCSALCTAAGAPCIGCRVEALDARGFEAAVLEALDACPPAGRLREYQQARLFLRRFVGIRRAAS